MPLKHVVFFRYSFSSFFFVCSVFFVKFPREGENIIQVILHVCYTVVYIHSHHVCLCVCVCVRVCVPVCVCACKILRVSFLCNCHVIVYVKLSFLFYYWVALPQEVFGEIILIICFFFCFCNLCKLFVRCFSSCSCIKHNIALLVCC